MVSLHFNKGVYHYYILGRQNNTLPTLSSHLLQLETWFVLLIIGKMRAEPLIYIFFLHSLILIFFFIFYQKVEYGKKGLF